MDGSIGFSTTQSIIYCPESSFTFQKKKKKVFLNFQKVQKNLERGVNFFWKKYDFMN